MTTIAREHRLAPHQFQVGAMLPTVCLRCAAPPDDQRHQQVELKHLPGQHDQADHAGGGHTYPAFWWKVVDAVRAGAGLGQLRGLVDGDDEQLLAILKELVADGVLDPQVAYGHKVLMAWDAAFAEFKALRHVRTPEGVAKYGLPIGSLIVDDSDVADAYALLDVDAAARLRKKKAAVKFYAKRDGLSNEEAQAKADAYEREALQAALPAQLEAEPPAPKPKKGVAPAVHPPSGRPSPYDDPLTRGGDGPLWGYTPGQKALRWNDGWKTVEVMDGEASVVEDEIWVPGADHQGRGTGRFRTEHRLPVVDLEPDGTRKQRTKYGELLPGSKYERENLGQVDFVYPADAADLLPLPPEGWAPPRVDPGYRIAPTLAAVDAAPLSLETLLPADDLETMRQVLKRKAVALDTAGDSFGGKLTPDVAALKSAKEDGLRALGRAFGFDDDETDEALARLDTMLDRWAMTGDIFDERLAMHRAVKALRAGEPADDVDKRAMLLQKAWSNATWDAKYGDAKTVRVGRFVTGAYAAQLEAAQRLTQPVSVPKVVGEGYDAYLSYDTVPPLRSPDDVTLNAFPLTSWSVTPGGVHTGWIGKWNESVELGLDATRDETWLNVWSEATFRTRGLKAPGEFILDDRRELNLGVVEVTVHRPTRDQPSRLFGGTSTDAQKDLASALLDHVQRHPNSDVSDGLTGVLLASQQRLGRWFPGLAALDSGEGSSFRYYLDGAPRRPRMESVWYRKDNGERYTPPLSFTSEPPYSEREQYEARRELVRDVKAEERMDALAAEAHQRGWTFNQVSRYLDRRNRWVDASTDYLALTHGREPASGLYTWDTKDRAEYRRRTEQATSAYEKAVADLLEAADALGLDVDRAWANERLAERWDEPFGMDSQSLNERLKPMTFVESAA